jgi:hypothetical protein
MQKASLDGTLESLIKEAASKIQPVREVMIRRTQLMQSGVDTKGGPTLEQVLEHEETEKQAVAFEDEAEEEDSFEEAPDEDPEEVVDESGEVEEAQPEEVAEDVEESDDSADYESKTVAQLKELLKQAGKPVSGKKAELIERLKE